MKCFKHSANDAIAVCAYCGRAVCPDCTQSQSATRIACSTACATELSRADGLLQHISAINQQLLQNSLRNTSASAFYCYLCAALSAAAAVVAWFMLPSPFLILFTGGCAVVLLLSGYWYGRAAKRWSK
jgi:hypothetical protein